MNAGEAYSRDLVRTHDKDRYLATLFAPQSAQPHLFALYAFDLEISRIRNQVSEPSIGLIRQQWWHDTLDGIYAGAAMDHPAAQALAHAIDAGKLPKEPLHALVTAREFDLYADPMPDLAALETYLGETSSTLIQMAAMSLDAAASRQAAEAAGFAGVALGFAAILGDPMRRKQFIPPGMDLAMAIRHARKRLAEARALRPKLAVAVLPAFLPVGLAGLYLDRIARAPDTPLDVSQFRRQITLWYHARRDSF
jgi:phytoene synthase